MIFRKRRTDDPDLDSITYVSDAVPPMNTYPNGQQDTDATGESVVLAAPDGTLPPDVDPADVANGFVAWTDIAPHLAELGRLQTERRDLIELCLYARDRVRTPAGAERIDAGLAGLGIVTLRPDGQPFDPSLHEAAASVPTPDPALHGTVAETEVPGYADHGMLVRPAVVSVYQRQDGT